MTVLESITELLKFQTFCTIAQIAKIADKKQSDVLLCINRNLHLVKRDGKGKVTGFVDTVQQMRAIAYQNGQSYRYATINYGAQQVIETNNVEAKEQLQEAYICGGLGDCWTVMAILKTEKNEQALDKMGIKPYDGVPVKTAHELWSE